MAHRTSALDIEIRAIRLISADGALQDKDIKFTVEQFRLNESLLLPITYGECWILDGVNLLAGMRAGNGFTKIQFEFGNPDDDSKLVTKQFRIYNVIDKVRTSNASQTYGILFCSEELFLASQYPVVKAYTEKLVSDMVKDICVNTLKIPQDRLYIEPTVGIQTYIMPWVRPFEAINKLCRKSLTASDHPSFVFYETLGSGFRFQSVESLFKAPSAAVYTYRQARLDSSVIDPYGIINYHVKKSFDALSDTQSGKYASNLMTFDVIRQAAETIKFDLEAFFAKSQHVEGKGTTASTSKMPAEVNRLGEAPNALSEAHSRFVFTTLKQPNNPYISSRMPNIKPQQIEKTDLQRNSFLQNFVDHRIKLTIPGNSSLSSGNIIEIEVISPEVQGDSAPTSDQLISGRYIITTISHYMTPMHKYFTDLTVVKDDVRTSPSSASSPSSGILRPGAGVSSKFFYNGMGWT